MEKENKHYYFGYGANTSIKSMARRCPQSKSLGAAVLPGWRLRFAYHADIVQDSLSHTNGVLWSITDKCLESLDSFEGFPEYYTRKFLSVSQGDSRVESWVYVMTPGFYNQLPSDSYFNLLVEGYEEHGINLEQIYKAVNESRIVV